jgi:transcription termination factor NusB
MSNAGSKGAGARTRARELLLQALYQKQVAEHSTDELVLQFHEQVAYDRVDKELTKSSLTSCCRRSAMHRMTSRKRSTI